MLAALNQRARKAGLSDRIEIRRATGRGLSIDDLANKADFAVAIHMVHEVPDQQAFFGEIFKALKPGGGLLIIEPKIHVSRKKFEGSLAEAGQMGFMTSPDRMNGLRAVLYKSQKKL
jgi:ubiquinone/menaquinone biosynthesis C-methylase UbiE